MIEGRRGTSLFLGIGLSLALALSLVWVVASRSHGSSPTPRGMRGSVASGASNEISVASGDLTINTKLVSSTLSEADGVFDVTWSSPSFPGFHKCTWQATGSDGAAVGSYSDVIAALSPTRDLPVSVPTQGRATDLQATCGPRLDVGQPYAYNFSNLTVTASPSAADQGQVRVSFDVKWAGPSTPGAVSCAISYSDPTGMILDDHDTFNFYALSGSIRGAEHWYSSPAFVATMPTSASMSCSPFTGLSS
jgi:hypothetical protein